MLTINKSDSTVRLLFTLTEQTTIENPYYLLVLKSAFSNIIHRFILPANTSSYTSRYDEFILNTSIFNNVVAGTYYYSVYQSEVSSEDETTMGNPVEQGLINVTVDTVSDIIALDPVDNESDYLSYNG